jgi:hypothetical protein
MKDKVGLAQKSHKNKISHLFLKNFRFDENLNVTIHDHVSTNSFIIQAWRLSKKYKGRFDSKMMRMVKK